MHLVNAADRGRRCCRARRKRWRGRHRRGLAAVFKIEPQPPVVHRALSGAATGVGASSATLPMARRSRCSTRCGSAISTRGHAPAARRGRRRHRRLRNSIGIPTVGGEIVRAVARRQPARQRLLPRHRQASDIIKGVATGVGNAVYYVGAKTAATASTARPGLAEFDDSRRRRSGGGGRRSVHGETAARGAPRGDATTR